MSPSVVKRSTQNKREDNSFCWRSHSANFSFNSMFSRRRLFISLSACFNFSSSSPIFVLCSAICLSKFGDLHVSSSKLVLGSQTASSVGSFFFAGSGCRSVGAFLFFSRGLSFFLQPKTAYFTKPAEQNKKLLIKDTPPGRRTPTPNSCYLFLTFPLYVEDKIAGIKHGG